MFNYKNKFDQSLNIQIKCFMDRHKRPPPLPKFEDKKDKANLEQQLSDFMTAISQTHDVKQKPKQQEQKSVAKSQAKEEPKVEKKKLTLASINSKLNNMLSAKKISVTTAISSEVQKEKKEEQRKIVQIEYDPQHPNSYELSKANYLALFAQMATDSEDDQEQNQNLAQVVEQIEEQWQPEEKQQIALRMMQKFGYRVGEGLGREGQGIRTPLIVRKTNDSSGIIEQSNIPLSYLIRPDVSARNALSVHNIQITQSLVLVGLLSLEQLQQGVEDEIKSQCCAYGIVCDWILYLFEGELRIFVEFQNSEQAFNAFVKMNGKYFGERLVSVRFYCTQHLRSKVLNDLLHPHILT